MEETYWKLREELDRAFDKWCGTRDNNDYVAYTIAKQKFEGFCVDTLTQLMEENQDVLLRLKTAGGIGE